MSTLCLDSPLVSSLPLPSPALSTSPFLLLPRLPPHSIPLSLSFPFLIHLPPNSYLPSSPLPSFIYLPLPSLSYLPFPSSFSSTFSLPSLIHFPPSPLIDLPSCLFFSYPPSFAISSLYLPSPSPALPSPPAVSCGIRGLVVFRDGSACSRDPRSCSRAKSFAFS